MIPESLWGPILTGLVSAAVTWGAVRVELRYLRRDVDQAAARIAVIERELILRARPPLPEL